MPPPPLHQGRTRIILVPLRRNLITLLEAPMLQTILIIIAVIVVIGVAALLGLTMTMPNTFRVQRSATMKALPEKIFPLINDFHQWPSWSPWEKLDPDMKRTHSGPESGPGAVYEWEGNKQVGKGRMEITEATPPSKLILKLDFLKPFEAHNMVDFQLDRQGDATHVTWAMYGPQNFMFKVMHLFFNMDKMIGKDYDKGLANLKSIVEK
jgi:hypothetical protein